MLQCPFCGKWFKNLKLHLHYCKMKNPTNICPACGKEFPDIHSLFEHMRTCPYFKEGKSKTTTTKPVVRFRGIQVPYPKPVRKYKGRKKKVEPKAIGEIIYKDDKIAVVLGPKNELIIEPLEVTEWRYTYRVPAWTWGTRKEIAEMFAIIPKPSFEPVLIPGDVVKKGVNAVISDLADRGLLKRWYVKRFLKALETAIKGELKRREIW